VKRVEAPQRQTAANAQGVQGPKNVKNPRNLKRLQVRAASSPGNETPSAAAVLSDTAVVRGRPRKAAAAQGAPDDSARSDILRVALAEFADRGFSGARISAIAEKIQTTKRMIFYYFQDKEGLYLAVLREAYRCMQRDIGSLHLDSLEPRQALRRMQEHAFDMHAGSPEFVRLVMIENVHHGEHLRRLLPSSPLNAGAVGMVARILERGWAQGLFRRDVDPVELHWMMVAPAFFYVSNRATFSMGVGDALFSDEGRQRLRTHLGDSLLQWVCGPQVVSDPKARNPAPTWPAGMNPQLHAFLAEWDARWATLSPGSGPAQRRAHFETIAAAMRLPTPAKVDAEAVHQVPTSAGEVRVRVFRWTGAPRLQPCLIYLHGGAWTQGSPETHWDITARLAAWCRMTVVSVDYAKAPERPFPAAFEQVCDVVGWVHDQADLLAVDAGRVAIGGDSAGANLAAAVALAYRGSRRALRAQLLIYPACDFDASRPSYRENADGPIVKVAHMQAVNRAYCPDERDLRSPFVAPLLAKDHSGLPPAFIAVAQFDPLRDSGLAYHDALVAAGVPVHLHRGEGLIHGYLRAMGHCDASGDALKAMAVWLAEQT
jgi:acetyl esterase/lipase/AcrR family transcriptional regulator